MAFETVIWKDESVVILDQTRLPHKTIYHTYLTPEEVAVAIEKMIVRGAPAIGVTAAFGLALVAHQIQTKQLAEARKELKRWAGRFAETRPTAVNLFWAIQRMTELSERKTEDVESWSTALVREAQAIHAEDLAACKEMGRLGEKFVPEGARILTHCNAGGLATAGWGTAVGVIRSAAAGGKKISVWVDETRPFLQGARLTTWELQDAGIPATLITDNMAGHFMARGEVDLVIVGADRIAANGDVANKIGTYSVAVLAFENKIPFYVAAPLSTLDLACPSGEKIPIEERDPQEVLQFAGNPVAPKGVTARHPAFDVTPARLVAAIITEAGVAEAPYAETLAKLKTR